ncbi:MAG: hypothetical protein ABJB86_25240, partial [Bacteroidota bacterium]
MTGKPNYARSIGIVFFFSLAGFILYYPIIGNTFLSDDYDSLYRICIEKRILYREMLRPMIDVSFYFNYLVSGLSAKSFYIFNIIVHILNCLLLYRFCLRLKIFSQKDQPIFAFIAALLFLFYPFHNESIAWLSGRLSSMACLFAFSALWLQENPSNKFCILLSVFSFLAGLLCYESIIILPVLIVMLNRSKFESFKKSIIYSFIWVLPVFAYLMAKIILSGSLNTEYSSRLTNGDWLSKILNAGKVSGRLFLPPSDQSWLFAILTALVVIILILLHLYFFRKKSFSNISLTNYQVILVGLIGSLLAPVFFGISTHTSEGDRLLYFPSFFLCMMLAAWLLMLSKRPVFRIGLAALICTYFLWFLEQNNHNWVDASIAASSIIRAGRAEAGQNTVFINVPDEIEGAFVFRHGFVKAGVINRLDTAHIKALNFLTRDNYLKLPDLIIPVIEDSVIKIAPLIHLVSG